MESWARRIEKQLHAKRRICGKCGKVRYDARDDATSVIREYRDRARTRPYYLPGDSPAMIPRRAYFDEWCGTWHVTRESARRDDDLDSTPFLELPAAPTAASGAHPDDYREAMALTLRDEIRRQGAGLRLPFRRALERHYPVPWPMVSQVRNLLVETGWLRSVPYADGCCYLTTDRRSAETSRMDPAKLSA